MSLAKRTHLRLESLDERVVPAVLNLTTVGSSGVANGALFQQRSAGADDDSSHTFLRLQESSFFGSLLTGEEGYNTNARPLQLDAVGNRDVTHALKLSDIPLVKIGNTDYREFLLTTNQPTWSSTITLDELRIYVGGADNLRGYNSSTGRLANMSAVYDMDRLGNNRTNNSVRINDSLNRTDADVRVLIPNSVFGSNPDAYVYLYSKFSSAFGTSLFSRSESWAVNEIPVAPSPGGGTASISGFVYAVPSGWAPGGEGNTPLFVGVTVTVTNLTTFESYEVPVDASGAFSLNGLAAGSYVIVQNFDEESNGYQENGAFAAEGGNVVNSNEITFDLVDNQNLGGLYFTDTFVGF